MTVPSSPMLELSNLVNLAGNFALGAISTPTQKSNRARRIADPLEGLKLKCDSELPAWKPALTLVTDSTP